MKQAVGTNDVATPGKKVSDVIAGSTKVAFRSEFEYCKRVIRAVMSVTGDKSNLWDKEVEILGVMCKMCIDGNDYMKGRAVILEMQRCGVEPMGMNTLKNYRSSFKKRGWIEGKQLNFMIRRAIADGGIAIGIFLKKDGGT